jgi:NitT/TauT family transport system substrate-binding protein
MGISFARRILRWRPVPAWLSLLVFPLLVAAILFALPEGSRGPLGPAGLDHLQRLAESRRYLHLYVMGTIAFAIAGFLRAVERRYDIWGAFVLTLLPAVGGGVIRDLLIGGERLPLGLLQDPLPLVLVLAVVLLGTTLSRLISPRQLAAPIWGRLLTVFDSIGLASFAVIGTRVALLAQLSWWWLPVAAALTCSGGGVLMDVVSGREPRSFQGEPYEELAILGSLVLVLLWSFAGRLEPLTWPVTAAMACSWWLVFLSRLLVVGLGWRSWRLGLPTG